MNTNETFEYIKETYFPDNENDTLSFADNAIPDELLWKYSQPMLRSTSINQSVITTIRENIDELEKAKDFLKSWIRNQSVVRVLGAGRALLAASLGGNRLAHAGAVVSFMGGMVPMPNSCQGGGIIAASASGQTRHVIDAMRIAKKNNPEIPIIGIAKYWEKAQEFMDLCDCFIGIHSKELKVENPLFALADEEEMVIAEILDGLVVLSGQELGYKEENWKMGHEDIGPTGPYSVKDK